MLLVSCQSPAIEIGKVSIIPLPVQLDLKDGYFVVHPGTVISFAQQEQETVARELAASIKQICAWPLEVRIGERGDIHFISDPSIVTEGYRLEVGDTDQGINIAASSPSGFYYGIQTLIQMLPSAVYDKGQVETEGWGIPAASIVDHPSFGWRGFMLDVSRHFFTVSEVKEVLDMMARLKMNRFHWHLTDDQGWRIEIQSYPKLTEIGAWRMDYNNTDESISDWWGRPAQQPGEIPTYGGYYTQEEIKEIVAYARERHIEIIPEIDMPGHSQAALAAYPELGCENAAPYVATGGVAGNNTFNPGKEETFVFAEKVLNEIMDLFPFEYVHIGGDECNKSQWKIDPHAQARIRSEGLKNEDELQSYFIKRIEKIVNQRNRIMIGWDEILEGGLAPNATVMSWRGEEGGIASAKAGHEVIMTPNKYCYVDLKQGHDDMEPNLGYSQSLLSAVYSYQVIPSSLNQAEAKLIKGIQANLWTESISDWGKLTYMVYPRILAVAENAWTPLDRKNWSHFTERVLDYYQILDQKKVRYAVSAFSPWIHHQGNGQKIDVSLTTEADGLDIYYTLDGTEPDLSSSRYSDPFTIDDTAIMSARAFKGDKPLGYVAKWPLWIHKARGVLQSDPTYAPLTDLNYASLSSADPNWLTFTDGVDVLLPLDSLMEVREVSFNSLRFTISAIYPPDKIEVYGSADGQEYTLLGSLDQTEQAIQQGRNKISSSVKFAPVRLTSLRVKANNFMIPTGHHRAGSQSRIRIDEIRVD